MSDLTYVQSVVLGVVEGLTEFLPVSSTGHLTITEKLMGLKVDDLAVTSFTAVVQLGAIVATLIYFRADIARLVVAFVGGLRDRERRATQDFRLAWFVIVGSIPVAVVGLALKDVITGPLRSLWVVAVALIAWSVVMVVAERRATQSKGERDLTLTDVLVIGLVQCIALVPGVSRSGATISAGLLRGVDRVTATRLSFFLAIPALTAAGLYELKDVDTRVIGVGQILVGTLVAFVVAYVSIAWLLRCSSTTASPWAWPWPCCSASERSRPPEGCGDRVTRLGRPDDSGPAPRDSRAAAPMTPMSPPAAGSPPSRGEPCRPPVSTLWRSSASPAWPCSPPRPRRPRPPPWGRASWRTSTRPAPSGSPGTTGARCAPWRQPLPR